MTYQAEAIKVLIMVLLAAFLAPRIKACSSGWFGKKCQYQCHCAGNKCDYKGSCQGSATCVPGWFGPECQYVDLGYRYDDTKQSGYVLQDGNDLTCMNKRSARIIMDDSYHIYWLRLIAKKSGSLSSYVVSFRDDKGANKACKKRKDIKTLGANAVDIYCAAEFVLEVILSGAGVSTLCTVHISGGRNVALKQNTSQTSTFNNWHPWVAVDGFLNTTYGPPSCSHTADDDSFPTWTLRFNRPQLITRMVIYNRWDCCQERLQAFKMWIYDKRGRALLNYTDPVVGPPLKIIKVNLLVRDATRVAISAVEGSSPALTLCEVLLYGETTCEPGKYGLDCDNTCHCAGPPANCISTTGGCSSGCAAGYHGAGCALGCLPTYYGPDCSSRCSTRCLDRLCDAVTGHCDDCPADMIGNDCGDCPARFYGILCKDICNSNCGGTGGCKSPGGICVDGCIVDYQGAHCTQECPDGTYGRACKDVCSSHCAGTGRCKSPGGICVDGCRDDYQGADCTQACRSGTYGKDCTGVCSNHCYGVGSCKSPGGTCVDGCKDGYQGLNCTQACDHGTYGHGCLTKCSRYCKVNLRKEPAICSPVAGRCLLGCLTGYKPPLCLRRTGKGGRTDTRTRQYVDTRTGNYTNITQGVGNTSYDDINPISRRFESVERFAFLGTAIFIVATILFVSSVTLVKIWLPADEDEKGAQEAGDGEGMGSEGTGEADAETAGERTPLESHESQRWEPAEGGIAQSAGASKNESLTFSTSFRLQGKQ